MHTIALEPIKDPKAHNPLMTHKFSADPYALVYDGRVYLYMTGDTYCYNDDGSIGQIKYSAIDTIRVISSEDLVNWTDHGDIAAAGKNGAASWGANSWAPAACYKIIDGKPKFFLYFANSGNGIAVLTSDSPTGPFIDPIGEALVSRKTPTCAEVTWLFDPAVLVDDDGCGYLYFGGGVPSDDKASNPGTARVVKLSEDMIHLESDPVPIENVLYLFEDSGINKIGNKYIYSYCSNFSVPKGGCEGYGFGNGEIITMVSDNPMGPFSTVGSILKNPEYFFEYGGNNHHCMFEFNGKWYVTYHASLIGEKMGQNLGYRSVNIDEISIDENGLFGVATGTVAGVEQLYSFNPRRETLFSTMANQMGISVIAGDNNSQTNPDARDSHVLIEEDGAFIQIIGADFGDGARTCKAKIKASADNNSVISIRTDALNGDDLGRIEIMPGGECMEIEIPLASQLSGISDIYFVFEGKGTECYSWIFE